MYTVPTYVSVDEIQEGGKKVLGPLLGFALNSWFYVKLFIKNAINAFLIMNSNEVKKSPCPKVLKITRKQPRV